MTFTGNSDIKFEVKSPLAKLLASENITFRHQPGARTAYFDVKNRVLVLPVWQNISEDLYDMLIVHEVGHALDTPADDWINHIETIARKHHADKYKSALGSVKNFMNVIEDARIDKRQKRRFPGSGRNYIAGYKELLARNFFGTEGRDINTLPFIDRINLYFKGGAMLNIKFSDEERKLVNRIANAETFDDVVSIADDVYAFAKSHRPDDDKKDIEDEDSDNLLNEEDFDDSSEEYSEDDTEEGEQSDDADGEESDEDEDTEGEASSGEQSEDDEDDAEPESGEEQDEDEDYIPESLTEKAAEAATSSIVRDDDVNYIYLTLPKMNVDKITDDYTKVIADMENDVKNYSSDIRSSNLQSFLEFRRTENDTISFMVKEFEMRKAAETYARASISKTGVLDTNKLHSYQFNEDIFRKLTAVPSGKSHGFVMLLDWSGSMLRHFKHTLRQLISLTMFCKRVQIPFEVYAFNDSYRNGVELYDNLKNNDLVFPKFKLRNILSSRMNVNTLNKAYELLWLQGSSQYTIFPTADIFNGTPLNQAILAMDTIVNQFRNKYKLQVVNTVILTDGGASDSGVIHGLNPYSQPYKKNGNHFILVDEVTKKQYHLGRSRYESTGFYLRILKERTNSNIMGFFVTPFLGDASYNIGREACCCPTNKAKWRTDGFLAMTAAGYDEFYVVNVNKLATDIKAPLDVNSKMTKGGIAKAFAKFSSKKSVNRVMLTKFITRVCTDNRKAA